MAQLWRLSLEGCLEALLCAAPEHSRPTDVNNLAQPPRTPPAPPPACQPRYPPPYLQLGLEEAVSPIFKSHGVSVLDFPCSPRGVSQASPQGCSVARCAG